MFKVECPGCRAPYQVDERRVPSSGLKMRCPKCGTSFQVDPPDDSRRTGPSPVLGDPGRAAGTAAGQGPPRPPQRPLAAKTIVGVAPSLGTQPKSPDRRAGESGPESELPAVVAPARRAPPPVPQRPKPAPPGPAADSADLPAPVAAKQSPSAATPIDAGLPALPVQAPIDLPALRQSDPPRERSAREDLEWELPTVGEAALPARIEARRPSPAGFELDLPDLAGELPSPAAAGLPARGLPPEIDLPEMSAGLPSPSAGLPSPSAGLPSPSVGLPLAAAGLPALGGSLPAPAAALPAPAAGLPGRLETPSFGELDLDGAGADFGAIDLPPPPSVGGRGPTPFSKPPALAPSADPLEADPFGEAPLAPPGSMPPAQRAVSAAPAAPVVRSAGGGTSYGEVNLDGEESHDAAPAGMSLEEPIRSAAARGEEDMEFGALPQESARPAQAPLDQRLPSVRPGAKSRTPARVFAALFVAAVGGGALSFVPSVGPYGVYWISDRLNASEHERLLEEARREATAKMARDSFADAKKAFELAGAAKSKAKRFLPLSAYQAFLGSLRELRFGAEPEVHAHVGVSLAELADEKGVSYLDLARAARAAVDGDLAGARARARAALQGRSGDADAHALAAEIELAAGDAKAALASWAALAKLETSARSDFGGARAAFAAGDAKAAEAGAKAALAKNPDHVGAKILLARIGIATDSAEQESLALLEAVTRGTAQASPDEIVSAETLLGDMHLARSRISVAEQAYGRALKLQPRDSQALLGLGEAQFRSGRFAEALARFEAGVQADAKNADLAIGAAKSKLALERIEEAARSLAKLVESNPKSASAALWYGRALEAKSERQKATAVYRRAIDVVGPDPILPELYIALAMLLNQDGQSDEAKKVLASARERLPASSALARAVGEVALSQGRHDDALVEFRKALELDPDDVSTRFKLGVALRRSRKLDEAARVFDEVAKLDKEHPGLALERGLLFEATGRGEEALEAYESALAKAPKDVDLMLRVGCGNVAAGRNAAAQEILRKVLGMRSNSAEANHCLGRALLAEGKIPDAQRFLDRALELDPSRAEYHLYVGWAASEAGNVARADRELAEALKLDGTLADAYWQRGVLRARQGAVRDAVKDLTKALELNPSRYDVHAALADTYFDLGREREALAEWQKAVEKNPENATWRFRYGKLLVVNHQNDAGRAQLERAIAWAEKTESPPRWLWEAHHLAARSLEGRGEAVHHWEQFLRLGPRDSPYRKEAKDALERAGKPWTGD